IRPHAIIARYRRAAETGIDVRVRRPILQRVQGGADFMQQYSAIIGRTVSKITIDDANRFKAFERLAQFECRKRPEPAQTDKTNLLAFFPQPAAGGASRRADGAKSNQNCVRVIGHELGEERTGVTFANNDVELTVSFFD